MESQKKVVEDGQHGTVKQNPEVQLNFLKDMIFCLVFAQRLLKQSSGAQPCLCARETTITNNYISKWTPIMKKEKKSSKVSKRKYEKGFILYDFLTIEYLLKWTQNAFFPNKKTLNSKLNFHWE